MAKALEHRGKHFSYTTDVNAASYWHMTILQIKTLMHKGTFLFMTDVYVQLIACMKKHLI